MEWIDQLNQLPITIGFLLIIIGFIMFRFPPRKIIFFIGYRTKRSMNSQESWDFSQKYAASEMMKSGVALLPMSLIGLVTSLSDFGNFAIIIVFIFVPILRTELKLHRKFRNIK